MHAAVTASRHGPSVSVACKAVSRRRACASEGAAHCSRPTHATVALSVATSCLGSAWPPLQPRLQGLIPAAERAARRDRVVAPPARLRKRLNASHGRRCPFGGMSGWGALLCGCFG